MTGIVYVLLRYHEGGTATEIRVSRDWWPWRSKFSRCSCRVSNPRLLDHEPGALTTECPSDMIVWLSFTRLGVHGVAIWEQVLTDLKKHPEIVKTLTDLRVSWLWSNRKKQKKKKRKKRRRKNNSKKKKTKKQKQQPQNTVKYTPKTSSSAAKQQQQTNKQTTKQKLARCSF